MAADEDYHVPNRQIVHPYTVAPRYNAVVGVHDIGPRCKQGALGVPYLPPGSY